MIKGSWGLVLMQQKKIFSSDFQLIRYIACLLFYFLSSFSLCYAETIDSRQAGAISANQAGTSIGGLLGRETIEPPDMVLETVFSPSTVSCMNHQPNTGTCIWLVCDPFPPNCKIVRNSEVTQFHPATVQFAYDQPGQFPSEGLKTIFSTIAINVLNIFVGGILGIDAGGGETTTSGEPIHTVHKEVSVFTNPGYPIFSQIFGSFLTVCPSIVPAVPGLALYHSEMNPLGSRDILGLVKLDRPDNLIRPIGGPAFAGLPTKIEELGPLSNVANVTDKGQGGYAISMRELHMYTDFFPTSMGTTLRPLAVRPNCKFQNESCHTYRMEPGSTNEGIIQPLLPNKQAVCGLLDGSSKFDPNYMKQTNKSGNIGNSVNHCVRCCPRPVGFSVKLIAQVSLSEAGCDLPGSFK